MPYPKQTWTDGSAGGTPISAARLTHIEDGLAVLDTALTTLDATVQGLAAALNTFAPSLSGLLDVEITSPPQIGDVLTWDGDVWAPSTPTGEAPPPPPASNTYVNLTSGVGVRNATNSHTIGHSTAPTPPSSGCALNFVPTVGRVLAVVVSGGVTSTSSSTDFGGSGWTKRLTVIGGAELALFTKTAVGNDFLTLGHNGTNYPVNWIAFEFPAGTTYTGGITGTSTSPSDTFPTLGSLPGSPAQFVLASYVVPVGAGTASPTGGATVSAPWVEDFDSLIAGDGSTDGDYLYVFHQVGVSATSITPALTENLNLSDDRVMVVAAFAVG